MAEHEADPTSDCIVHLFVLTPRLKNTISATEACCLLFLSHFHLCTSGSKSHHSYGLAKAKEDNLTRAHDREPARCLELDLDLRLNLGLILQLVNARPKSACEAATVRERAQSRFVFLWIVDEGLALGTVGR